MKFELQSLTPEFFTGVIEVAQALPEWFDGDARNRAIPIDVRFQKGNVALQEQRVIGFILLNVSEGRVNISWMGVHPEFHHQGVGHALIAAAEDYCRLIGLDELATYTLGDSVDYAPYVATRAFYASQGFTIYQRSATDNPSCPEEIRLKKVVTS